MNVVVAGLAGVLVASGTSLLLHRSLTRIVLGIGLLANAVNLLLLTAGSEPGRPPLSGPGQSAADPVPQALVLTAIVISFGTVAFLLALAYRSWTIDGNDIVEDDIEDRRVAAGHGGDGDEPETADGPGGGTAEGRSDLTGDRVGGTADSGCEP